MKRQIKLGAFLPAPGHHVAAWRHPDVERGGGLNFSYYSKIARLAEKGLFDLMFLSDGAGVRHTYKEADDLSRWGFPPPPLLRLILGSLRVICETSHSP